MFLQRINYQFALYSKYFLITQTYIPDIYYKRIPYREKHQQLLESLTKNQAQIIGGALFPLNGAYYIVNCNHEDTIKYFLKADPYTLNNLASSTYEEIQPESDIFDQLAQQFDYK